MKHWKKVLQKNKNGILTYASIILLLLILLFVFLDFVKIIVTICMFIFLNILLRFYRRMLPGIPIEFEVVIFGSMVTTIAFGFWAGLFVALLGSVFAEFLNQQISPYSLVNFGCYIIVPIVAFFLRGAAVSNFAMVITAGIVLTVIVNLIIFTIFIIMGYDHFKNAAFSITNIFFNYLLFKYLTIPVLGLLM